MKFTKKEIWIYTLAFTALIVTMVLNTITGHSNSNKSFVIAIVISLGLILFFKLRMNDKS